jgi:hypothetical protein
MMFSGSLDEYIGIVATTQAEKLKAIESGCEFVSADPDGTQYFRKRKDITPLPVNTGFIP